MIDQTNKTGLDVEVSTLAMTTSRGPLTRVDLKHSEQKVRHRS